MKKFLLVALCLATVFTLGAALGKSLSISRQDKPKDDDDIDVREGSEDEGIFLLTVFLG